jgi:hypothetical protein
MARALACKTYGATVTCAPNQISTACIGEVGLISTTKPMVAVVPTMLAINA